MGKANANPLRQQGGPYERADLFNYRFNEPVGTVFWVYSGTGSGTGTSFGLSPEAPLSTLDEAIGRCTANNGDVILCMPGHAETITTAGGVALDVAGVTVRGLGEGRNRPVFTMTNTDNAPSFDISGANCLVENLVLICDDDAQTAMVNVTAAGVTIRKCELVLGTASKQAVIGILGSAAADRIVIEDCYLHGTADAGTDHAISLGACDDAIIRNNIIVGAFAVGGLIENDAAAINFSVLDNFLLNQTADGNNKLVVLHASTNGIIMGNRGGIIDSSAPAPITCAAGWVAGNWFSSAVGVTASVLM